MGWLFYFPISTLSEIGFPIFEERILSFTLWSDGHDSKTTDQSTIVSLLKDYLYRSIFVSISSILLVAHTRIEIELSLPLRKRISQFISDFISGKEIWIVQSCLCGDEIESSYPTLSGNEIETPLLGAEMVTLTLIVTMAYALVVVGDSGF